jgi:hypothetical protein
MAAASGLPMSLDRYGASVPVGSPDRIWLGPLRKFHRVEVHTRTEWEALVAQLKATPVSYDNLRRPAPGYRR